MTDSFNNSHSKIANRKPNFLFFFFLIPFSQGLLDPILALNLSRYLVKEVHPVPWDVARRSAKCLWGVFSKPHKLLYKVQRLS